MRYVSDMKITKATVILNERTADMVILNIGDMPSSMPCVTTEPLDVIFFAAYDTGLEYVKTNLPGVPTTVIPRPK